MTELGTEVAPDHGQPSSPRLAVRGITLALFFASGVSGLVYQVMWVRGFAAVFGNTMHSAALVTGVFMGGLGLGSYVFGRWADRWHRGDPRAPLRWYGYAEVIIAAFGLALALAVPRLTTLSASFAGYQIDDNGWHALSAGTLAFHYAVAIVLLALPTFVMGGTLTLLIRFLVGSEVGSAGFRIGLLYGLNTAGAALGALLTDLLLVRRLGLVDTQLTAVVINGCAGAAAIRLSQTLPRRRGRPLMTENEPTGPEGRRLVGLTALALAVSGFAAMGIEMVWFRYLSQLLGQLRAVFSMLLAVVLVGLWVGATLGGYLHRKLGRPGLLFMVTQSLLALATVALLGLFDHHAAWLQSLDAVRDRHLAADPSARAWLELGINLRPMVVVVALPAVLMGFAFPLANAHVQRSGPVVGRRAGALYLGNTVGNVLGAVAAGFVLLPTIGIRHTTLVLTALAALAVVPLTLSHGPGRRPVKPGRPPAESSHRGYALAASLLAVGWGLYGFSQLPAERLLLPAIPRGDEGGTRSRIALSEGLNETLVVVEVPGVARSLYTNGHPMSSTSSAAQRYMRAFAHVPLLQHGAARRVLVICFGVGNTLHAASLHPSVQALEVVDLSRHVLRHAPYFEQWNRGVLQDERVQVFVNDGRHHLLMQPEGHYDLITLEPPPIAFAGVSALYSRELYELARSRLAPGGFMTQWLPIYQVPPEVALSLVRAFIEVFPESVLLSGDDRELILMGTTGPSIIADATAVAQRMEGSPALRAELRQVYLDSPTELFGTFAASYATMAAATADVRPLTDDWPVLEHSHWANLQTTELPARLFDVSGIDAWCPRCAGQIAGLSDYLHVRDAIYRCGSFLRGDPTASANLGGDPRARSAIDGSDYLKGLLTGESFHLRRLGQAHLERGDLPAAAGVFRRIIHLRPTDADAHFDLGLTLHRGGDKDAAEALLQRALKLDPRNPRGNAVLCRRAVRTGKLEAARAHCAVARASGVPLSEELEAALRPEPPPRTSDDEHQDDDR